MLFYLIFIFINKDNMNKIKFSEFISNVNEKITNINYGNKSNSFLLNIKHDYYMETTIKNFLDHMIISYNSSISNYSEDIVYDQIEKTTNNIKCLLLVLSQNLNFNTASDYSNHMENQSQLLYFLFLKDIFSSQECSYLFKSFFLFIHFYIFNFICKTLYTNGFNSIINQTVNELLTVFNSFLENNLFFNEKELISINQFFNIHLLLIQSYVCNHDWELPLQISEHININNQPHIVLSIAGSDSSGGAGIQADLNTFHSNKVFGMTVITALTAQNSMGVQSILPVNKEFLIEQLKSVFDDYNIEAVKLGMIYDKESMIVISEFLKEQKKSKDFSIVVDPVMISTSGHGLQKEDASNYLVEYIFPISDIITPNICEAKRILNVISQMNIKKSCSIDDNQEYNINNLDEMKYAAKKIVKSLNIKACLVKGGHLNIDGYSIDVLYDSINNSHYLFKEEYLITNNTHGTGCSLSSAIASNLSKKYDIITSIDKAKTYVFKAIKKGFLIGKSEYGTLCHY